jgi:hypothetical protein
MRLVVALFVAAILAQSQQPSPTPPKVGQVDQQKHPTDQTQVRPQDEVPKGSPIIINNQLSASPSDRTEQTDRNKSQDDAPSKWISDELLALFTALLVVVAVLQWLTARGHERELIAMAGNMRRSLILTQRPHLTVRRIMLDEPAYGNRFISARIGEAPFKPDVSISGRFSLVNRGNGLARIIDSSCAFLIAGPPDRLPREFKPHQGIWTPPIPIGTVLQPGQIEECKFLGKGPSLEAYKYAYSTDNPPPEGIHFYVTGWISYADELGLTRRTNFCRQYAHPLDRFFPVADSDYENED